MNEIRVLRIVNRFNLGGITYNVSYLSRYMHEGFTTLLAGGPEEPGELSSLFIPRSLQLEPTIIPRMRRSLNPLADLFVYLEIKKLIRQFRPHIVHTHASKAGAVGRLAAAHCKVPVIVHTFHGHIFRGYFGKTKTQLYKSIERFLARRSHAVVAISPSQKYELCEVHHICPAAKTHVIPLGFDLDKFTRDQPAKRKSFRTEFSISENDVAVCIIGRLAPVKNHQLFVRAAARCMKAAGRKIRAVIVGDGEMRNTIIEEIKKTGRSYAEGPDPNADFLLAGWRKDVDVVLSGSDIVCLTSWNEGTPVSLIEAQAAGKFIVSTEAGGVRDILHPGCGLLSAPGDETAFAHNLARAVTGFEQLKSQAGKASADVLARFSHRRLCADMETLYKDLLKKAGITE